MAERGTGRGEFAAAEGGSTPGTGARVGVPAGWGRRITALIIDWLVANLAAFALVRDGAVWQPPTTWIDFVPLAVFGVEVWLLTAFVGASVGHRLRGLVVVRTDGTAVGPVRAFIRTALILLVLPPVLVGADGRGLHDRLAGTMILQVAGS
ncbi:MAG TPA: RDD family protein [Actinopolymorphaceae bacterium]